jgi:hypothetical protein
MKCYECEGTGMLYARNHVSPWSAASPDDMYDEIECEACDASGVAQCGGCGLARSINGSEEFCVECDSESVAEVAEFFPASSGRWEHRGNRYDWIEGPSADKMTAFTQGARVQVTGEQGGRDLADTWTVQSVGRHGMILQRERDGKRGCLPLNGVGTLSWSNGPKFITIRSNCYAEVI